MTTKMSLFFIMTNNERAILFLVSFILSLSMITFCNRANCFEGFSSINSHQGIFIPERDLDNEMVSCIIHSILFALLCQIINIDKKHSIDSYLSNMISPRRRTCNPTTYLTISILLFISYLSIFSQKNYNPIQYIIHASKKPFVLDFIKYNDDVIGLSYGCVNENIDRGRSYDNVNIDISDCSFSRFSQYDTCGGVIYVSLGSHSMSVSYSIFYSCVCSIYGGAIYFESNDSSLKMICAYKCSSTSPYYSFHFALLQSANVNEVEFLSMINQEGIQSENIISRLNAPSHMLND